MTSVLVTGGANGIGHAIVGRLAASGNTVGVLDRDEDAANEVVNEVHARGGRARAFAADIGDEDTVNAQVNAFASWAGGIDGLVNNAGGFRQSDKIDDVTVTEWDAVMAVNLRGPFLSTRAAVVHLRQSDSGRVVNIASVAGRTAIVGASLPYTAAKAGLIGFTRKLATELAAEGIAVNAIAPGLVDTPRVRGLHADRLEGLLESVPAGRLADVEEIAAVVEFLLGPEASYLVGATIDVNGGRVPL